jgi:hypothetical protein
MEEKIIYWENERKEFLEKLSNTKDTFLIMQYKIQLDIIESYLRKLKTK